MKISLAILVLLFASVSFGQDLDEVKYEHIRKLFPGDGKNKKEYSRFQLKIDSVGKNYYKYGDRIIFLNFQNIPAENFVLSGFNPEILFGEGKKGDSINLCCLQELEKINPDAQTRRFSFWLFSKLFLNPTEWYIELYNKNATKETPLADFFKGSVMTFYYAGTIII